MDVLYSAIQQVQHLCSACDHDITHGLPLGLAFQLSRFLPRLIALKNRPFPDDEANVVHLINSPLALSGFEFKVKILDPL